MELPRPEAVPDLLLDAERLNVLLDIVCADYVTASYASRENARRVVLSALAKLQISVLAGSSLPVDTRRDSPFHARALEFHDDLARELRARAEALGARALDDAAVREVMKPRLVQFVEELYKDRERQLAQLNAPAGLARSASAPVAQTQTETVVPAPSPPTTGEIRMEGWLRKKGQHVNLWRERYFMIRTSANGSHFLCYFRKKGDKEPRGWYVLGPGTTVDEVRESPSKIETKKLFTFRIRHLANASSDDIEDSVVTGSHIVNEHTPMSASSSRSGMDIPLSPDGSGMDDFDPKVAAKKINQRRFRNRAAAAAAAATAATAVVLTGGLAGVGIGMVGMGMSAAAAAAGAGAAGAMIAQNRGKGPIALAAESLETAEWWRNSILECIAQAEEQWKRYLSWYMDHDHSEVESSRVRATSTTVEESSDEATSRSTTASKSRTANAAPANSTTTSAATTGASRQGSSGNCTTTPNPSTATAAPANAQANPAGPRQRSGSFGSVPRSIAKTFRTSATFSQETNWKLYDFSSKLRVDTEGSYQHGPPTKGPPPALRTSIKVNASPKRVFEMLMNTNSTFYKANHVIQEARVLEENTVDHSDVVYWKLFPTYLWPVHVEARDLCLLRYWRKEQDSSYFVCFQSTTHTKCPSPKNAAAVRANILGGGFIISPRVEAEESFEECWVTLTIQINPKGWIDSPLARSWYYMHAYGVHFLEMITSITANDGGSPTYRPPLSMHRGSFSSPLAGSMSPTSGSAASQLIISEGRFPMLEPFRTDLSVSHGLGTKFWSEPDASTFLIRGPHYLSTKGKVPSARQLLRLIDVELYRSSDPIENIGVSSFDPSGFSGFSVDGESADAKPFVFIVNFMLPGTPRHSLVLYYTAEDPAELRKNSVFADLCHEFLHGSSDVFRTQRLKLIPRVVQGTWPIREGVGTTPAILGTKLNQRYYQTRDYLEIDYDIGSSTVASSLLKLLLGFSRDLVIDLGFVIEAQSSLELPERMLGCVRLNCIDMQNAVPYSKQSQTKDHKGGRT